MTLTPGKAIALTLVVGVILCGMFGGFAGLGMEQPVQIALVILLTGAILWVSEAVPLFVTSLVILLLSRIWLLDAITADGTKMSATVFLAPFFSDIILLFLGGFVLSSALHKYHIDQDLARKIIKHTGKSIPLLMAGIMAVTAFLSMWLSNTATTAMMLALILPIIRKLPANDKYRVGIVLSIPMAANIGGLGTPIGTPPNAIAMKYMEQAGNAPSFIQWVLMATPCVICLLIVMWGLLMFFFKGYSKGIEVEDTPRKSVYTPRSLVVVGICLLTVIGWMTGRLHGFSSGTVSLLPLVLLFGFGLLNTSDLRALSWDVLLVMGGGLCLGKVVSNSGLAAWLIERLPIAGLDPFLLSVILAVVACIMSSMMSNTATANLMMPILLGLGSAFLSPIMVSVAFSCSLAMALPISTPPNAMAFSTDELTVKDMMKPGLTGTIFGLLFTFSVAWWWWGVVGLF